MQVRSSSPPSSSSAAPGGPVPAPSEISAALGRARMLVSMLSAPALRRALGRRLAGDDSTEEPSMPEPLSRLGWLGPEGGVDVEALRDMSDAPGLMLSDQAAIAVPPLAGIPVKPEESLKDSAKLR